MNFSQFCNYFFYSLNGFKVGLFSYVLSFFLDNTVSQKTKKLLHDKDPELLIEGYKKVSINLLVLSPIYYYFLENYLIVNHTNKFEFTKYILILLIQSSFYYYTHYLMHKNTYLKNIHLFHHKFTEYIIPSIGNAVSELEFTLAYAFPFIFGSTILQSNLKTLNYSIFTISIFNMAIHCDELKYIIYYKYFVSPSDHLNHHSLIKKTKNTYSAPIINIDNILDDINYK